MNVKLGNLKPSVLNLWSKSNAGRTGLNQRDTLHASRDTNLSSTTVECALQIHPFLTNKANFQKS